MCNTPVLLRDSGNFVVLVYMQVSWFCSLSLGLWMALEETSRHRMFSLSSCSLAEKLQHQPAVISPTWVLGVHSWKMLKVPYSVYFVLSSTILVMGSLTLGNCPTSQGKLLYGRSGHIWISAGKGIYCWARSRKLQSLFPSLQVSDLDGHHIPLLLLYFSSFQTLRHHQTAKTTTFQ